MANRVQPTQVGVDVSKAELVISINGDKPFALPNTLKAIRQWLRQMAGPLELAMEATSHFHLVLADEAHRRGHCVYLINGYRLNRYRDSIGGRAKTDEQDACLLVRYLQRERADLRPWVPPSRQHRQLQVLLHRRATLVQAKVRLQQSFSEIKELAVSLRALVRQIERVDLLMQKQIRQVMTQAGWLADAQRCQAIEGIGPLTAAALVMAYHRGNFRNSDAFIAFLGLDVRVRDSGTKRGRRCLTKQGDPELRRLLYLAAMQARQRPVWQGFYQRYLDRGLAAIQVFVILARKLARVAFSLMRNQTEY
ncbi:MAG: transposase, partial [Gammaproteobacteria bacterium]